MTLFVIGLDEPAIWADGSEKAAVCFGEKLNSDPGYIEDVLEWLKGYASDWGVYDDDDEADVVAEAVGVAEVYQRLARQAGCGELIHIDRIIYHERP